MSAGVGARMRRLRETWGRLAGRGVYPEALAFLLDLPLRRLFMPPGPVVERLGLGGSERVLELGPGPGYFSPELARRLPRGRLVLCDLQRGMLRRARRKLRETPSRRVAFVQAHGAHLPFGEARFDAAFLVAVLGEVSSPEAAVRALLRTLRPGGLLCVTEVRGDPDRVSLPELRHLALEAGFEEVELSGLERGSYTASFRRPAPAARGR